jgi:hypothetical protein
LQAALEIHLNYQNISINCPYCVQINFLEIFWLIWRLAALMDIFELQIVEEIKVILLSQT